MRVPRRIGPAGVASVVGVVCVAALAPVAGARAAHRNPTSGHGPTPAQVRRAVTRATHSHYLWATVNVCVRHHRGGVMGVRGEMPALGFDATLAMTIQLRQYDSSQHRFVVVRGATARHVTTLGAVRGGVRQGGAEFPYTTDTGNLDATVTFTWTRAGRRLASTTHTTSAGHHAAAFGQPKGYSAASCTL